MDGTRTVVFAKTDPATKARLVTAPRAAGHTVGYLGDGVNDAPALHAADIGVADATDLARETADVIRSTKTSTCWPTASPKAAAPSPTR